jgi:hypothetical protein
MRMVSGVIECVVFKSKRVYPALTFEGILINTEILIPVDDVYVGRPAVTRKLVRSQRGATACKNYTQRWVGCA